MKIKRIIKWGAGAILLGVIVWFLMAYWTSTNDCKRYAASPTNPVKAIVYCDYGVANVKVQDKRISANLADKIARTRM
jgi:hypothetical protein